MSGSLTPGSAASPVCISFLLSIAWFVLRVPTMPFLQSHEALFKNLLSQKACLCCPSLIVLKLIAHSHMLLSSALSLLSHTLIHVCRERGEGEGEGKEKHKEGKRGREKEGEREKGKVRKQGERERRRP